MIKRTAFAMLLAIATLAGCQRETKQVTAEATPTVRNDMPSFVVDQPDNTQLSMKTLTGNVIIVLFNPDCDHCQREAQAIAANKELFRPYEVYFVSPDAMTPIMEFAKTYDLSEPNFHFGRADGPSVVAAVGQIQQVPTIFVYRDQTLIRRLEGETSIETLKTIL